MKIGELAKRSGLAPSRIRFYESIGLLKTVERGSNGYRTYPQDAVQMLEIISAAQNAGFSLDEIRVLLPQDLAHWEHDKLIDALRRKVKEIEAMQARLADNKKQLVTLLKQIEAQPEGGDCAANAQIVLSQIQRGKLENPGMATGDVKLMRKGRGRRSAKAD